MRKLFGRINNKTFFYPKTMTVYEVLPVHYGPLFRWKVDKVFEYKVRLETWPTRPMQLNGCRRFYEPRNGLGPSQGVDELFLSRKEAVDALGRLRTGQPFLLEWR
jgi:hypothetical protein